MFTSSNLTKQELVQTNAAPVLAGSTAWSRLDWRSLVRTLAVLFKLRIVSLLLLAATGGAFLGAAGWPGGGRLAGGRYPGSGMADRRPGRSRGISAKPIFGARLR